MSRRCTAFRAAYGVSTDAICGTATTDAAEGGETVPRSGCWLRARSHDGRGVDTEVGEQDASGVAARAARDGATGVGRGSGLVQPIDR